MKVSDEELMVMFSAGTAAAFSMLYDRYRHRVYRFAVACLESAADAEDAVQEVFIRVARAADRYQPANRFKSWLFQISANCIRDIGRQRTRYQTRNPAQLSDSTPEEGDCGRFERRLHASDALERLLVSLQPDEKVLLMLKELEGLDCVSIAGIMNITPETVRVRLHRIRARLKSEKSAGNRGARHEL